MDFWIFICFLQFDISVIQVFVTYVNIIIYSDSVLETDRVFGEKCKTKQVYEQGIKDVALSVVRGVNCE